MWWQCLSKRRQWESISDIDNHWSQRFHRSTFSSRQSSSFVVSAWLHLPASSSPPVKFYLLLCSSRALAKFNEKAHKHSIFHTSVIQELSVWRQLGQMGWEGIIYNQKNNHTTLSPRVNCATFMLPPSLYKVALTSGSYQVLISS